MGHSESPYSGPLRITGENPWEWKSDDSAAGKTDFAANGAFTDNLGQADAEKDKGFIESIVSGKPHNQIALGVESARSAMLARMAARQKRMVTWDELLAKGETFELGMDLNQFA